VALAFEREREEREREGGERTVRKIRYGNSNR
jgi:hypothetical protein